MPGGRRLGYVPALDGVRAFAIVSVILFHADIPHLRGGGEGVLIFFVLSGFLITSLLLQERSETGEVRLRSFYARRALRLLPALVVMLLVVGAVCVHYRALPVAHATLSFLPAALFYVGNWVRAFHDHDTAGMLEHTWSLSVEEQFYLVWPLAMFALWRWKGRAAVIAAAMTVAALADLGRVVVFAVEPYNAAIYRVQGTDLACDGLLLGAALAAYRSSGADLGKWCARLAPGAWIYLLAVAVLARNTDATHSQVHVYDTVLWPLVDVAAVLVIAALVDYPGTVAKLLGSAIPRYLGRISYSLYLWHIPVFAIMAIRWPSLASHPHRLWIWEISASFVVAVGSYHLVERPALRLKQRFEPQHQRREQPSFTTLAAR